MQVVLWCEQVNLHYAAWLRSLAGMNGFSVKVVASVLVTPDRKKLGWPPAAMAPAHAVIANGPAELDDALAACDADAVHIVEGIRGTSIARHALRRLVAAGCRVGIVSEGGDSRGVRGFARRAVYYASLVWKLREDVDFVLAMGEAGVEWYSSCGVSRKRLFPFAYTADMPGASAPSKSTNTSDGVFRIVYLGQCIERKGIQDLFEALERIGTEKVLLSIIGDGYLRPTLEVAASRSTALRGRVEFAGVMRYSDAVASISNFDLLVLPSHFDGWGVVVNEALMQGTPVICSDRCGAKDLLAESWRGGVFRSGCVQSLVGELSSRVKLGRVASERREQLRAWSRRLNGNSMAEYFVSILDNVYGQKDRPAPPWRADDRDGVVREGQGHFRVKEDSRAAWNAGENKL